MIDMSKESSQSIIDLNHNEAKEFFIKNESYCNLDLPSYIDFSKVLTFVSNKISTKGLEDVKKEIKEENTKTTKIDPKNIDNINHILLNNKDGKYCWRKFQLIHPILYVFIVNEITKKSNWIQIISRFSQFQKNENIRCLSYPRKSSSNESDKAEQVSYWFNNIEQESIILAMDYKYLFQTDIQDCYNSIYTHSIPWAIHSKETIKENLQSKEKLKFTGNQIDYYIQCMSYGQTNGIPQGSVLMDFIAEIVLGYGDLLLSDKIEKTKIKDYRILRYRDDYRIFVNNFSDGEEILKLISNTLMDLGMSLNKEKTKESKNVIKASLKTDKLDWLKTSFLSNYRNNQQLLLFIHDFALRHPNSGSLQKALSLFFDKIATENKITNIEPLISIIVDVAYNNPRTYPICISILSILISSIKKIEKKKEVLQKISNKFIEIPNHGYLDIWMQRVTKKMNFAEMGEFDYSYEEKICRLIDGEEIKIWNCDWLKEEYRINTKDIFDKEKYNELPEIVSREEALLFNKNYYQ
jgi:RNA-directed DNA polymerase